MPESLRIDHKKIPNSRPPRTRLSQYWLVRWGSTMRGPYDKTDNPQSAGFQAFGICTPEMAFRSIGTRRNLWMGSKFTRVVGPLIMDPNGWVNRNLDPIPPEAIQAAVYHIEGWAKMISGLLKEVPNGL